MPDNTQYPGRGEVQRQVRRRRRIPLACAPCRRRKIKCDRSTPCSNCVTAGKRCVFPKASKEEEEDQDQEADHGTNNTNACINASAGRRQKGSAEPSFDEARLPTHSPPEQEPEPEIDTPRSSGSNAIEVSALRVPDDVVLAQTSQAILQRRSGLQAPCIHMNKTKMLRFTHWMGLADEIAPIKNFFVDCRKSVQKDAVISHTIDNMPSLTVSDGTVSHSTTHETAILLQKCKHLARSRKAARPSRFLSNADLILTFPSKQVADEMISLYLRNFESTHRIVHIPTFQALYDSYWVRPDDCESVHVRLLVHLAAVVGSSHWLGQEAPLDVRTHADHVIHATQVWLAGPLAKHRLTIIALQIYCLLILARALFTLGGDPPWIPAGELVHRAMQMGLHRDPTYLPRMCLLEAETRRRLWATILEIVLQSSLDSAMPPRISLDEFDTKAPANLNDADLPDGTQPPRPLTEYTDVSVQLLLYNALPLRFRSLYLSFDVRAGLSYREALVLESGLIEASRTAVKFFQDSKRSGATNLNRNMVDYMLRRFLILLHFPFSMETNRDPLFDHSAQVCIDAGMAILYPEADETFSRRIAYAGGMYREGLKMAVWVFGLPLLKLAERQSVNAAAQSQDTLSRQLHFLQRACEDMITLAAGRIQHGGETSINIHLFLSMVQAQAEAMQQGKNATLAIAEAARDSARLSYQELCSQDHRAPATSPDEFSWFPDTETSPSLFNGLLADFDDDLGFFD